MKNIGMNIAVHGLGILFAGLLLVSCTGDFDRINRNPYEITKEELGRERYNIGSTLKGLQGLVVPTEEHRYQFVECLAAQPFAGYMGATVPWTDKFETYNPPVAWQKAPFGDMITETYPLYRDMLDKTDDPVALALAKVLKVAIMHRVTDMYGPIPYSKVLAEDGSVSLTVGYDSQEAVYDRMFQELDEALAVLEKNAGISPDAFRKFDAVYSGDIGRWVKFVNSLKLRMAMRIVYADAAKAQAKAEEAVAGGVIADNADNAQLTVEENRAAMIYNDWGDHRAGAAIVSYKQGYKDPRMEKMFTKVKIKYFTPDWKPAEKEDFAGIRIGIDVTNKEDVVNAYSKPVIKDSDPFVWLTAAEVSFLRAEGALRGWNMGGEAKELYERGIALSFEQRGASGAEAYCADATDKPAAYEDPKKTHSAARPASDITVAWEDGANAFERNLERIITQKWIAIFPLGVEAWSEHRRTGYPKLLPVVENKSGGVIDAGLGIRRLWSPTIESTENPEHLQEAITLLGGPDNGATPLWWDKKNNQ